MTRTPRYRALGGDDECDPLSGLVNLFDVGMVFAVALMVAFVIQSRMTEFLTSQDVTWVKNAGKPDMEIIVKKGKKISRFKSERTSGAGRGQRIGVAYRLEDGEIIYVPEGDDNAHQQ